MVLRDWLKEERRCRANEAGNPLGQDLGGSLKDLKLRLKLLFGRGADFEPTVSNGSIQVWKGVPQIPSETMAYVKSKRRKLKSLKKERLKVVAMFWNVVALSLEDIAQEDSVQKQIDQTRHIFSKILKSNGAKGYANFQIREKKIMEIFQENESARNIYRYLKNSESPWGIPDIFGCSQHEVFKLLENDKKMRDWKEKIDGVIEQYDAWIDALCEEILDDLFSAANKKHYNQYTYSLTADEEDLFWLLFDCIPPQGSKKLISELKKDRWERLDETDREKIWNIINDIYQKCGDKTIKRYIRSYPMEDMNVEGELSLIKLKLLDPAKYRLRQKCIELCFLIRDFMDVDEKAETDFTLRDKKITIWDLEDGEKYLGKMIHLLKKGQEEESAEEDIFPDYENEVLNAIFYQLLDEG